MPCVCCPVRCRQECSKPCLVSVAWSDAGRDAAMPFVCCPVRCGQGHSKPCPVSAGTFGECSSEAEVQSWMRYNTFLLLEVGTFNALVELLNMEIE